MSTLADDARQIISDHASFFDVPFPVAARHLTELLGDTGHDSDSCQICAAIQGDQEIEWGIEVAPGEIRRVPSSWVEDGGRPKAKGVPLPIYRRTVTHGPWVLT